MRAATTYLERLALLEEGTSNTFQKCLLGALEVPPCRSAEFHGAPEPPATPPAPRPRSTAAGLPEVAGSTVSYEPPPASELARSDRCRHCGELLDWRRPGAAPFADGSGAHVACYEQAEINRLLAAGRRAVESADALADPCEVALHGEALP
jgi:hypothetical protein